MTRSLTSAPSSARHVRPADPPLTGIVQRILAPIARRVPGLRKLTLRERAFQLVLTDRLNAIRSQTLTDRGVRA